MCPGIGKWTVEESGSPPTGCEAERAATSYPRYLAGNPAHQTENCSYSQYTSIAT